MRRWPAVLAALVALPACAHIPADTIDLREATYHESPNVSNWPVTVHLRGIEYAPGETRGVRPIFDRAQANAHWPDVLIWPNPTNPLDGYIQFTLYMFVRVNGVWHGGGMIQFWGDRKGPPREWTGAPILTQWKDWVYWAPSLAAHQPRAGEEVAFMLVAGNRRRMNKGDVMERSNVITVPVLAEGVAESTR